MKCVFTSDRSTKTNVSSGDQATNGLSDSITVDGGAVALVESGLRNDKPMQQTRFPFVQEHGVSLLELAIFLPIIVLLVAGVIDYGSALREVQAISSASREGARIAASHARIHSLRICNAGHKPSVGTCANPGTGDFQIAATDAINDAARKAACGFIASSGLNGADWQVSAVVPDANSPKYTVDNMSFQMIHVTVEKTDAARKCILCWDRLLDAFKAKADSSFTLESPCDDS
ncbi:MAG: TadE family protein [Bdellovibrionota bacterium]